MMISHEFLKANEFFRRNALMSNFVLQINKFRKFEISTKTVLFFFTTRKKNDVLLASYFLSVNSSLRFGFFSKYSSKWAIFIVKDDKYYCN